MKNRNLTNIDWLKNICGKNTREGILCIQIITYYLEELLKYYERNEKYFV